MTHLPSLQRRRRVESSLEGSISAAPKQPARPASRTSPSPHLRKMLRRQDNEMYPSPTTTVARSTPEDPAQPTAADTQTQGPNEGDSSDSSNAPQDDSTSNDSNNNNNTNNNNNNNNEQDEQGGQDNAGEDGSTGEVQQNAQATEQQGQDSQTAAAAATEDIQEAAATSDASPATSNSQQDASSSSSSLTSESESTSSSTEDSSSLSSASFSDSDSLSSLLSQESSDSNSAEPTGDLLGNESSSDSGTQTGTIVGIVVAICVVALLAIAIGGIVLYRRKKRKYQEERQSLALGAAYGNEEASQYQGRPLSFIKSVQRTLDKTASSTPTTSSFVGGGTFQRMSEAQPPHPPSMQQVQNQAADPFRDGYGPGAAQLHEAIGSTRSNTPEEHAAQQQQQRHVYHQHQPSGSELSSALAPSSAGQSSGAISGEAPVQFDSTHSLPLQTGHPYQHHPQHPQREEWW